jgi:lipoprotein-anchoring transpeptidase ErfK/SrfK
MKFSYSFSILALLIVFFTNAISHAAIKVVANPFAGQVAPGTIVIHASERALYFIGSGGTALRYPVAVPKSGKEWSGTTSVERKVQNPDWTPPAVVAHDHPELPNLIPGGDPHNPMGVAAIVLGRSEIAIHGTTQTMRKSIGSAASYGCIRMLNEDVADLYQRVNVGTPVVMVP